jgi:D-alanyl-D-alanine carboxypeptidase
MRATAVRVLAAAAALVIAVPAAASAATPRPHPLQAALDSLVAAGAPGAVLIDRHGHRTLSLASGYADIVERRAMRPGDRFRAASQMKSFTAVIVLHLAAAAPAPHGSAGDHAVLGLAHPRVLRHG